MPIHDQGYRRYAGHRRPHGQTWWVIGRSQLLRQLREKRFVVLLLAAWLPFVGRVVQIYIGSNFRQVSFLAATSELFRSFLAQQSIFVFLVMVAMAGAIADDRRANALQLYLSKPLTRLEYVGGKLVAPMVFVLGVTLLPALLLLAVQVAFSGSLEFLRSHLFLVPAITLFCVVEALLVTFTMLALSSLSKSRRFAALTYAGAFFFMSAMYQALRSITGSSLWAVLSPADVMTAVGDAAFRLPAGSQVPVPAAAASIAVLIAISVLVLERRVRGVDVVR